MSKKGQFGYLKKQAVTQGLYALGMVAVSAILFLCGYFWFPKFNTIFTVIAVLGMLPAAKFIVSMILFMRAEKHSCSLKIFEKTQAVIGNKAEELLGYDFYLTGYDKNFPLAVVFIKKGSLIALAANTKCDCNKAKEHIELYMKKNAISGIAVKIFNEEQKFIDRLSQLLSEECETTDNEKQLYALMKNLSL